MVHIVVGLFKDENRAGEAVSALKKRVTAKDISLIVKDKESGEIHVHQVKQAGEMTPLQGLNVGAEIGGVVGVIGGLSTIINPAMASLAIVGPMMVAMGFLGSTVGELVGGFVGAENEDALPPERAKLYKDRIKRGEVFVSVSTDVSHEKVLKQIFEKFGATHVQAMTTKD